MATGYTAVLHDKSVTFAEFAMRCARSCNALISMRDSSLDAEIPNEFKPSPFCEEQLGKARENLEKACTYTLEDAERLAAKADERILEIEGKIARDQAEKRMRYQEMLKQARAWEPPTPDHGGLKEFMIQQLEESISHDCSEYHALYQPKQQTAEVWLKIEIEEAEDRVTYYKEEVVKEQQRAIERTAWVQQLRASLEQ